MLIGIIADTHISLGMNYEGLLEKLKHAFDGVDLIIHAGDVCVEEFLESLRTIAPVTAICGNSDKESIVKKYKSLEIIEIGKSRIAISHQEISPSFLQQEKINIVITGHQHYPEIKEEPGILYLNPGSTTRPRSPPIKKMYQKQRLPLPSVILLELTDDFSSAYIYSFSVD